MNNHEMSSYRSCLAEPVVQGEANRGNIFIIYSCSVRYRTDRDNRFIYKKMETCEFNRRIHRRSTSLFAFGQC